MAALASVPALLLVGCDSTYTEPPTRCDDWCLATQRANCADDWPQQCVTKCEFFGPGRYSQCLPAWEALLDCYAATNDAMFQCVGATSQPRPGVCQRERSRYERCAQPVIGGCLESCSARAHACTGFDETGCISGCGEVPTDCLEAVPYFDCLAAASSCDGGAPECLEAKQARDGCGERARP